MNNCFTAVGSDITPVANVFQLGRQLREVRMAAFWDNFSFWDEQRVRAFMRWCAEEGVAQALAELAEYGRSKRSRLR